MDVSDISDVVIGSRILEYAFGVETLILLVLIVWIIKTWQASQESSGLRMEKLMESLNDHSRALQALTESNRDLVQVVIKHTDKVGEMTDMLRFKPCMMTDPHLVRSLIRQAVVEQAPGGAHP
jgi:hypothetical protein